MLVGQMWAIKVWKSDLGKMLQTYDEIEDELGPAKDVAKETIEKEVHTHNFVIFRSNVYLSIFYIFKRLKMCQSRF